MSSLPEIHGGGYDLKKSKVAYFGGLGKSLVSASPLYNMMRYNSKLINADTFSQVVDSLNKYKPEFIQGLPSSIYFFCRLLQEKGVSLARPIKGVILASENIYPHQRNFIEQTLKCRALSHYGHTERVVFAEEILSNDMRPRYCFNKLYGYTEIDSGNDGCIIGTGFINRKMPLLRYKTDDSAKLISNGLFYIEGHRTAAMVGKNGERISAASFAHMDTIFDTIDKFQLVQDTPGKIKVCIVPKGCLTDKERRMIRRSLDEKFMGKMQVELCETDHVQLTERGKYALLIQRIPNDYERC